MHQYFLNACRLFLLFMTIGFLYGCASGAQAVAKMTDNEKEFAAKLDQIEKGMTEEQVAQILGPNYGRGLGICTWSLPNSGMNQVRVYFWDDKVYNVRWMKMGAFTYSPLQNKE